MAERVEIPKEHRAIRLLRCRNTNLYFSEEGWTKDLKSAKVFFDAMEAAQACVRHGLVDVQLVLRAQGGEAELFSTPLR